MTSPKTSAGRGKRSSKRSAAKRKPPNPTFYVDECLGKAVPASLAAAGHDIRPWFNHYPGQPDTVWLPEIGARGWVLLTKDKQIKKRALEVHAILNAGVRAFILITSGLRGDEQADIFLKAMRKVYRICRLRGPFVFTMTRSGILSQVSRRALVRRSRRADA